MKKEEPKKETPEQHLELINNNIEEFDKAIELFRKRKSKQETLEEFIERASSECDIIHFCKHEFERFIKLGAKWQQQQNKNLYSEEEVRELLYKIMNYNLPNKELDNWFNQNKKK